MANYNKNVKIGEEEKELQPQPKKVHCTCGSPCEWSKYCGANVCTTCGRHQGLARCYCGWSVTGGDGRLELEDMGEVIDPEPDIGYGDPD